MSGYTVLIVFVLVAVLCGVTWVAAPKENRTVWRSSVILGISMCFLMWAITYLSQLHPLQAPRRADLRPEM
ncbi:V-type proton ATPase subunit e [[Candida] jaroonii]|uniref:V-type proton ATPase subunit e n=1 Tax=[Candida] jaroonii TaxID=467808 RepID=A0ACA9Y6B4_9ASCO|nr:V-type proton ATPase subunit e [[Candida] jaroonii]